MLTKKERMAKLNNAGINTSKYFNINLPEGLAPGATISIVINEDGVPVIAGPKAIDSMMRFKEEFGNNHDKSAAWPGLGPDFDALESDYKLDQIRNQIIEDGYVRNTKLHRRFVMAQMFHMLNYVSYNKKFAGYNDCLKRNYGYDYTLKMMMEEVRVLGKLEVRDRESFVERSHFFDKEVVVAVMEDYLEKLKQYVETLPNRNCKGIPYKRIKKMDVFVEDLSKKIYVPVRMHINEIVYAKNYAQIYNVLEKFARSYIKLPYDTPKSKVWIDAYKGAGAYYTMKNLVMFHDCFVVDENSVIEDTYYSMKFLSSKLDEYKGEGWRMFALMKKVIKDNDFNFKARMEEIYNN